MFEWQTDLDSVSAPVAAIAVMTMIDFDVHFVIDLDPKICTTFPQAQSHFTK